MALAPTSVPPAEEDLPQLPEVREAISEEEGAKSVHEGRAAISQEEGRKDDTCQAEKQT